MNIKQQAHTKMLVAVLGVLDSFKTIWQAVVAFASAHDALAAAIAAIRAEELKQSGVTTGVTENKRLARQAMCSAAAVVGGAVAAYAEQQGKHDLFDSVDFSAPDLLHQTEADCLTHCTDIFNAARPTLPRSPPPARLRRRPHRPQHKNWRVQHPAHVTTPGQGGHEGRDRFVAGQD